MSATATATPDSTDDLLAIHAITTLKSRYFRFIDTREWTALRTLFLPDATLHFVHRTVAPESLENAISRISTILAPDVASVHSGGLPEIEVEGTVASAIWPMSDLLIFPTDRPNPLGLARLHGFGYYHERYERRADGWRIATLRLERLHVDTIPLPYAIDLQEPS